MARNPYDSFELTLRDKNIAVCYAVPGNCIVGAIFFAQTVNTKIYLKIFEAFCAQLIANEKVLPSSGSNWPHI